ncbi:MAG TPA: PHB depolymerase family esterase [Bdellovibrionota bacterium]|jgi:poly(hydroxyalkanoate) depolymerase family esterase
MKHLIALALLTLTLGTSAFAGQTVTGEQRNAAGSRSYKLFLPSKLSGGLVVMLHGCFLTGDQMATGTDINTYAEAKGFAVLYPEQGYGDNSWKCWNWFKKENQARGTGEASIIVDMVKAVSQKYKLKSGNAYVAGLSAGSAMAANLLGCYSDIFAGAALGSGLEFAAAESESEAHQVTRSGPSKDLDKSAEQALACSPKRTKPMRVIVVHGDKDAYVNIVNGQRTAELFARINTAIWTRNGGSDSEVTQANSRIEQGGYNYSAAVSTLSYGGEPMVTKIIVEGMAHGWSGGKPTAPYMEPRGVNATEIAVKAFFP